MTIKKYTYILLFLFCSFPLIAQKPNTQKLSKKERKQAEKFEKIKTNLENQTFSYNAKWSIYESKRTKMSMAGYSYIKLKGNTMSSSLVYHGKLNGQYVEDLHDSLIRIASEISNYSITYKDNGNTIIASLNVKQNSEKYDIEITASRGNPVILKLTSNNREPVTYEGVIR